MTRPVVYLLCAVLYTYRAGRGCVARAQSFESPQVTFQNITFDLVRRGTYNMSYCSKMMINCWEIVKPDEVCSYEKYYESACGQIREYCDDTQGDQTYWHMYQMREAYCNTVAFLWGSYEDYTRRRRTQRTQRTHGPHAAAADKRAH